MQEEVDNESIKNKEFPNDNMITYVGICLGIISIFDYIYDIPSEYVVSITFAGFFFVYADAIEVVKVHTNKLNILHSLFFFFGVLSFIVLPVVFLTVPSLFDKVYDMADSYTILSLGIVLMILNLRLKRSRAEYINNIFKLYSNSLDQREEILNVLDKNMPALKLEIKELKKEIEMLKRINEDKND